MSASLLDTLIAMGQRARAAAAQLALASGRDKNQALEASAAALLEARDRILRANEEDLQEAAAKQVSGALMDRLRLDPKRIEAMAASLREVAALADPIGVLQKEWTRPNGMRIQRVSVPLGVIAIIYESRPNVTADAGALCLKSGNAAILRGGSESARSSAAVHACLVRGLKDAGLPPEAIQRVPTTDRAAVGHLLADLRDYIDVVVPRGGKPLIERVRREARVPVIGHLEGVCHVYVDGGADLAMAKRIVLNAKMRRTGVCGAAETLLVDRACAPTHLKPLVDLLIESGCEVRGDEATRSTNPKVREATESDWHTEYLDAILAVKVVDGVEGAIEHIARYGSHHTDAIVTAHNEAARIFQLKVDSAIVLHNASTQFADGAEFGMGAEIGISTDKFHARGPVGLEQLTSYKYLIQGSGQIRD